MRSLKYWTVLSFFVLAAVGCDDGTEEVDSGTTADSGGGDTDAGGGGDCATRCVERHLSCGAPGFFADWPWCPDYCDAADEAQEACLFETECMDLGAAAMTNTFPCDVPEPPSCEERCYEAHIGCGAPEEFRMAPWCSQYCEAAMPDQLNCLVRETSCTDLEFHGRGGTFPCGVESPMPADGGVPADDGGTSSGDAGASDAGAAPDAGV
ncbi:MAG: hypothetical protein VYE22_18150 [Myxococcota bacterium]|nr:hypothetical protein [Myxococcota bacterium]